jgi:hypothetical protein
MDMVASTGMIANATERDLKKSSHEDIEEWRGGMKRH